MIYSVEELLPVFVDNFEGFCDLYETEQEELVMKYARRAETHIDRLSFYRLKEAAEKFSDEVKLTICEVAELMYKEEMYGNTVCENTDGYAVTYKEPMSIYLKGKIRETCEDYLGFTGIFQRSMFIN